MTGCCGEKSTLTSHLASGSTRGVSILRNAVTPNVSGTGIELTPVIDGARGRAEGLCTVPGHPERGTSVCLMAGVRTPNTRPLQRNIPLAHDAHAPVQCRRA